MSQPLTTNRLTLRLPRSDDAERITLFLSDYAVASNLARVPFPYRMADARAWLRGRRPDLPPEDTNFAIELAEEGYAGQVGFHRGDNGVIIGYWLGPPFWGRGIMTEAVTAALDWFFNTSNADKVLSGVFVFNLASLAIQAKLGFTETGRSSVLSLARGTEVEHIDTQLTRAQWMDTHK
ncbi:GNAT family N-acetyltransferase [Devosia algicola]|uniref:GNAT family N-acetyltransferase n=1 Tax=Devosia algicola TaxID=3026418 RepID=A0ABY7YKQ0_9HYPH|nr:GNAT family N-acetyltransferase [Devosia algicola]WDR01545.1 GNAT family N-acetyltransferase [Devosia algicola]